LLRPFRQHFVLLLLRELEMLRAEETEAWPFRPVLASRIAAAHIALQSSSRAASCRPVLRQRRGDPLCEQLREPFHENVEWMRGASGHRSRLVSVAVAIQEGGDEDCLCASFSGSRPREPGSAQTALALRRGLIQNPAFTLLLPNGNHHALSIPPPLRRPALRLCRPRATGHRVFEKGRPGCREERCQPIRGEGSRGGEEGGKPAAGEADQREAPR